MADEFVFLDNIPFSKGSWRNRNRIKTADGVKWLTIPLQKSSNANINTILTTGTKWPALHWKKLMYNYCKAPFFEQYADPFDKLYSSLKENNLSRINRVFIETINSILHITTPLSWSDAYTQVTGKTERLIAICRSCGANTYLSGPAARSYLNEALFNKEGIAVEWMDYSGYPEYHQLFPPFRHEVTILDLLFNTGPDIYKFMKSF